MAHDSGMVRKPDVLVLIMHALGFNGATGAELVVDDKGALDINFNGAGVGNGLL
jgi:hypothetical protein